MDKEFWKNNAKEYNGVLVVWVDQATDPLLKIGNSSGVCFAMARKFAIDYQKGAPGPYEFVNGIRDASLVPPGTSRIPKEYLDLQAAYQANLDQYKQSLAQLKTQIDEAELEQKKALLADLIKLKDVQVKKLYGSTLDAFIQFKELNVIASETILDKMKAIVTDKGPSYFVVGMRGDHGGHGIAFGFRPDLSSPPNFPGIFEYFDANLGLFVFGSEEELRKFFSLDVWSALYGTLDYNKFDIASFTAVPGKR